MQVVIDIPEKIFTDLRQSGFVYDEDKEKIVNATRFGVCLDTVMDEISSLNEGISELRKAVLEING